MELSKALAAAEPGDRIVLADGVYVGTFAAARPGTSSEQISLCDTAKAIIDGGDFEDV